METDARAPSPVGSATGRMRLDSIDGLRGFACLYVVLYHVFLLWPVSAHVIGDTAPTPIRLLTSFAAYGHVGVDLFLALSGFCLFFPLCRRATAAGAASLPNVEPGDFARRRARRILPPYLAALAIFSVLPLWTDWSMLVQPLPNASELAAHLLLIHNLFPSTVLRIDGPLWSLALEAQLYLIFPVLVVLFRRLGAPTFAWTILVGCLAFRIVGWDIFGARGAALEGQFVLMSSLPGRIFEFAAGMVAAYAVSMRQQWHARMRWLAPLSLVCGVLLAYLTDKQFGEHSPLPSVLWGVASFGLIVSAADEDSWLIRAFRWRPLVGIGTCSYTIYLLHEPLLRLTGGYALRFGWIGVPGLGMFVGVVGPVILGVCLIAFVVFERPFLGRSDRSRLFFSLRPAVQTAIAFLVSTAALRSPR